MDVKISDLTKGGSYSSEQLVLMLNKVSRGNFKNKEGFYYKLDFQDVSGVISGNMWTVPKELEYIEAKCSEMNGVYVGVTCVVEEYQGKLQLNVSKIVEIAEDKVDPKKFLPMVVRDRNDLLKQVRVLISLVKDKEYRELIIAVFSNPDYLNGFMNGIGGIKMHHNYIGGLMEHSVQVTLAGLFVCDNPYMFPELNRDLIIVGGLLHDIGKIEEYLFSRSFSMNEDEVEHRYGGVALIEKVILLNKINIDKKKLKKLKNIIMSHHGSFGDPGVRLESAEAIVIHNCDAMSAHVNGKLKEEGILNVPFATRQEVAVTE